MKVASTSSSQVLLLVISWGPSIARKFILPIFDPCRLFNDTIFSRQYLSYWNIVLRLAPRATICQNNIPFGYRTMMEIIDSLSTCKRLKANSNNWYYANKNLPKRNSVCVIYLQINNALIQQYDILMIFISFREEKKKHIQTQQR